MADAENSPNRPSTVNRTLKLKALCPSDWWLYKEILSHYHLESGKDTTSDLRNVFVLGLRLIYSQSLDPDRKKAILMFANEILNSNLDKIQKDQMPEYKKLDELGF